MKIISHVYIFGSRRERENLKLPKLFWNPIHFDITSHFQQENMTCCPLRNQNPHCQSQQERKTEEVFKIILCDSIKTTFFRRLLWRPVSSYSQGASSLLTVYPGSLAFTTRPHEHCGLLTSCFQDGCDNLQLAVSISKEDRNVLGTRKKSKPEFFTSYRSSLHTSGIRTLV